MLTKRQKEIALMVADGYTSQEIADQLSVSKSTVENILYNVYKKLSIKRRPQLVKHLAANNLLNVE